GERLVLLLARRRRTHARDAPRGADLVDIARPAVVEHPFVTPLVAELLDQGGNEANDRVVGVDRGLRIKLLHRVDDRGGVLNAFFLRRYHQGDNRHPGMFLEFRLAVSIAQNPLMGDGFVAKIGAYLYRVGRHLGADDAIAVRHGIVLRFKFLDGLSPVLFRNDLYHLKHRVVRTRVANAPTEQTGRSDDANRAAGIVGAGHLGYEFFPRRSGVEGSASPSSAGSPVPPYRAASRPPG